MCIACNAGMTAFLKASASRSEFLQYAAFSATSSAFAAWGSHAIAAQAPRSDAQEGMADVIFRGGPILTMSERSPRAGAIAIRNGRILAVGHASDLEEHRGPDTRIVDLGGRTLLPGLIDPHMHFAGVQFDDWVNVSAIVTPTYDAVQAKLQRRRPKKRRLGTRADGSVTHAFDTTCATHFMLESWPCPYVNRSPFNARTRPCGFTYWGPHRRIDEPAVRAVRPNLPSRRFAGVSAAARRLPGFTLAHCGIGLLAGKRSRSSDLEEAPNPLPGAWTHGLGKG